ncbi:MAG: acetyl-CoA carboxylase carboxyl transferase subunit beta [Verrucomicrobiales bacterium]|jgi:acetyl-CoA carboxylase carboxyl transferase subunit beta
MPIFKKPPFGFARSIKKEMPEGLWHKCPSCSNVVHDIELRKNHRVCHHCTHHFQLSAANRLTLITDPDSFQETDSELVTVDVLEFEGYAKKVAHYREKTKLNEAIVTGRATIGNHPVSIGVMDFSFLGASMGVVVGEKITRLIERATAENAAAIVFAASGGARMHEGILSLMQMAKTSAALGRHAEARLPYISVLTHPTTGGVTASFATLGDVIIAEPKCMIGFAGPRVVKETTHQNLPPGFQTAEFMLDHGLVDRIIERKDMRRTLSSLLGFMMPEKSRASA